MKMVIEFREVDILDAITERVRSAVGFPIAISKIHIKKVGGGMNEDPTFGATIEIEVSDTPQPYPDLPHYRIGQRGSDNV